MEHFDEFIRENEEYDLNEVKKRKKVKNPMKELMVKNKKLKETLADMKAKKTGTKLSKLRMERVGYLMQANDAQILIYKELAKK